MGKIRLTASGLIAQLIANLETKIRVSEEDLAFHHEMKRTIEAISYDHGRINALKAELNYLKYVALTLTQN